MSRLSRESARLYAPLAAERQGVHEPDQLPRALVLELARPAEWLPLAAVWQGVQADLGLPAPAVAVNGADGLQLWFSMAEPLARARADAFLLGLRQRYLPGWPDLSPVRLGWVSPRMPAQRADGGCWAAFLAPDLAALFADTPWLDLAPGDDGQADLLAPLMSITPAQFEVAMARLQSAAPASAPAPMAVVGTRVQGPQEARQFLLSVMNDRDAPLALRVESAKALLGGGRSG